MLKIISSPVKKISHMLIVLFTALFMSGGYYAVPINRSLNTAPPDLIEKMEQIIFGNHVLIEHDNNLYPDTPVLCHVVIVDVSNNVEIYSNSYEFLIDEAGKIIYDTSLS